MANEELESWQNVGKGRIVIKRTAERGGFKDELIVGGKTFHITTKDRKVNSEMAATNDLDPFRNGLLSPVRLLDSSDDAAEIASNPNLMGESEMKELIKAHHKTFEKRINEVKNPVTVQRILEVAVEEDAPLSRVDALKARLEEVSPSLYNEVTSIVSNQGTAGNPIAPPKRL